MRAIQILMVAGVLSAAAFTGPAAAQTDNSPGQTATGRKVRGIPSDALGKCNDGSFVSTGNKAHACETRGGLKTWYSDGTPQVGANDPDTRPASGAIATGEKVSGVPSDALGLCNDGTYVSTGKKDTACADHGGMKKWYPG